MLMNERIWKYMPTQVPYLGLSGLRIHTHRLPASSSLHAELACDEKGGRGTEGPSQVWMPLAEIEISLTSRTSASCREGLST